MLGGRKAYVVPLASRQHPLTQMERNAQLGPLLCEMCYTCHLLGSCELPDGDTHTHNTDEKTKAQVSEVHKVTSSGWAPSQAEPETDLGASR